MAENVAQTNYFKELRNRYSKHNALGGLICFGLVIIWLGVNVFNNLNKPFAFYTDLALIFMCALGFSHVLWKFLYRLPYAKKIYFFLDHSGIFDWSKHRPNATFTSPIIELSLNFFSLTCRLITTPTPAEDQWFLLKNGAKIYWPHRTLTLEMVSPMDQFGNVQIIRVSPFDAIQLLMTSKNFDELISKK